MNDRQIVHIEFLITPISRGLIENPFDVFQH